MILNMSGTKNILSISGTRAALYWTGWCRRRRREEVFLCRKGESSFLFEHSVNWHAAVRKCVSDCLDLNELLQDLYPYRLTDQFYPDSRKRFCLNILLFFARYDFSYSCLLQVGAGLKITDGCSEGPGVKRRHLMSHFCCWILSSYLYCAVCMSKSSVNPSSMGVLYGILL